MNTNDKYQVEELARMLHESGREAVAKGAVVNKVPEQPFYEWGELSAEAQEGRRHQAQFLLGEYEVMVALGMTHPYLDLVRKQISMDESMDPVTRLSAEILSDITLWETND